MENVRQRMFKQIEEARIFGIQSFSKDLLEVADVLKMAVDSAPKASEVNDIDVNDGAIKPDRGPAHGSFHNSDMCNGFNTLSSGILSWLRNRALSPSWKQYLAHFTAAGMAQASEATSSVN